MSTMKTAMDRAIPRARKPVDFARELQKRVRFLEGQARGIRQMCEDERDSADVLIQLLALQSAAGAAAELIARDHVVQRIAKLIERALRNCLGDCDLCDQLKDGTSLLEPNDYSELVTELTKLTASSRNFRLSSDTKEVVISEEAVEDHGSGVGDAEADGDRVHLQQLTEP